MSEGCYSRRLLPADQFLIQERGLWQAPYHGWIPCDWIPCDWIHCGWHLGDDRAWGCQRL